MGGWHRRVMAKRNRVEEKQWSAADAARILDAADRSPTDSGFCRAHGINAGRVAWWRSKLKRLRRHRSPNGTRAKRVKKISVRARASRSAAPAFVEVVAGSPPSSVEIRLVNGRELRVGLNADPEKVARLAVALERC